MNYLIGKHNLQVGLAPLSKAVGLIWQLESGTISRSDAERVIIVEVLASLI